MTTMATPSSNLEKELPVVDEQRLRDTYAELKRMEVHLDPNPLDYGPKRFNNRIAHVRAMLNRVEQIFLQTSEDLHYLKRVINAKRGLYELEKRDLMVNDPKCRVGRAQGEREALADVQLRSQIEGIQRLELAAYDLETLMMSIKSRRADLKNAQTKMRDQMTLIEHDLGMGAQWGRKSGLDVTGGIETVGIEQIDTVLAQVDADLGVSEEDSEEEVDEEEVDEEEVEEEEVEEEVTSPVPSRDPSPRTGPEPVLELGGPEEATDLDILFQGDGNALPDASGTQEAADSFLESLGTIDRDEPPPEPEAAGIDDLIASFADD